MFYSDPTTSKQQHYAEMEKRLIEISQSIEEYLALPPKPKVYRKQKADKYPGLNGPIGDMP